MGFRRTGGPRKAKWLPKRTNNLHRKRKFGGVDRHRTGAGVSHLTTKIAKVKYVTQINTVGLSYTFINNKYNTSHDTSACPTFRRDELKMQQEAVSITFS